MQLTPHFSLDEMSRSAKADAVGLDNDVPLELRENVRYMAQVMETVRAAFDRPVTVLSCYRSPAVNAAVGGSKTSAHLKGLACDFRIPGVPVIEVCRWIRDNLTGIDQVIYEFGPDGWCHLGLRVDEPIRQQALTAIKRNGKTHYLTGIVGGAP